MERVQFYIYEFFKDLVVLTNDMSFWLLLGFLIAGILYTWFPRSKVKKYLGSSDSRSVINSAILGIPLPLCSCGVIPTGVSFYKNGASKGSSVSFLISTPQTGVDSIMVTYSMLGLPFAIIRPIVAFFTGVIGGIITNNITKKEQPDQNLQNTNFAENNDKRPALVKVFHYGFVEFMEDIAKWLVIGILLAALISVAVPDDFFSHYIKSDLLGMLIILAASVPLYVCATSSVPIAAVLLLKGLSPGAALVFLMAGPATNAATITVIGKSMGRKTLISYLATIIGGALLSGIFINYVLPREWFTLAMPSGHLHHEHELIPSWLQYGSSILLILLIVYSLIRKYLPPKNKKSSVKQDVKISHMNTNTITVKGMNCNHCKMNVTNSLNTIKGIKVLDVDLSSETVVIEGENPDFDQIKKAVEDIGYKFEK